MPMTTDRGRLSRTWLLMLVWMVGSVALAAGEGSGPPALTGTTWQWTHLADGARPLDVPSADYTLRFADDGSLTGRADCNGFNGTFLAGSGNIAIVPGAMTLMACPEGSLGNEFVRLLDHVASFGFTERGELKLEAPADNSSLTFVAQPEVIGSVTYRERIALPPEAAVRVRLLDVSVADAPPVVLGEQFFETHGAQVPFSFAVPYPLTGIREAGRYELAASIVDNAGSTLFSTDMNVPVITGGNPVSDVNIVLVMVNP